MKQQTDTCGCFWQQNSADLRERKQTTGNQGCKKKPPANIILPSSADRVREKEAKEEQKYQEYIQKRRETVLSLKQNIDSHRVRIPRLLASRFCGLRDRWWDGGCEWEITNPQKLLNCGPRAHKLTVPGLFQKARVDSSIGTLAPVALPSLSVVPIIIVAERAANIPVNGMSLLATPIAVQWL